MRTPKWNRVTITCHKIIIEGVDLWPVKVRAGNGKPIACMGVHSNYLTAMGAAWRTYALFVMDPGVDELILKGPKITDYASYRRYHPLQTYKADHNRRLLQYKLAMQA